MYSKIIKNIFFPLHQMKLPHDERFITYMNLLNKTQWWNSSELEKFQLKKLKQLLKHANDNVPFYHEMFKKLNFKPDNVTNINNLNRLPILTKDIIRNNFEKLNARNYSKDRLISSATGGSTGTPMKFFIDKRWQACNMAAAYRAWGWAGYRLGDKTAFLWSAHQDIQNSKNFVAKAQKFILRDITLDAFDLTDETIEKYISIFNKFKPKFINSYSSAIYLIADYMQKRGINNINPRAILTTADMLYDYKRKLIEQIFNCDVFDYYSGRDTSLQAAECSEHFGYHLSIENAVVEFVKENEIVSQGETGKIIITDLCNYAMPLIRYEIGDLGVPSDEKCPCGRKLPIMKSIKGRILDTIITPDGKMISGMLLPAIFAYYDIKGIYEYQIIQKRIDMLLVRLVKGKDYSKKNLNLFINIIKKKVGDDMKIEIQFVEKIEPTASGKHRSVISEILKG
ncbi:MAG: hypothetical protein MUO82_04210 [Candidatus Thermoplasmatota archaeon]|nr:hypothetical protein [Candidatus Thermoplasmatota archaeon]